MSDELRSVLDMSGSVVCGDWKDVPRWGNRDDVPRGPDGTNAAVVVEVEYGMVDRVLMSESIMEPARLVLGSRGSMPKDACGPPAGNEPGDKDGECS